MVSGSVSGFIISYLILKHKEARLEMFFKAFKSILLKLKRGKREEISPNHPSLNVEVLCFVLIV